MIYLISALSLIANEVECLVGRNGRFTIFTEGCTIPGVPEESERIKDQSSLPKKYCFQNNLLLESNSSHIWVVKNELNNYNVIDDNEFYCCYRNFSAYETINNILYSDCVLFKTVIKAQHEFVRIECYYLESELYTDYFVFKDDDIKPKRQINKSEFNVIILGMDGISRLNFERTMPKTAKFISDRGAIQIRGYNKVGDNSLPNLFPLLTGRSFSSCREDTCGYIWERFKDAGYYTAVGSDSSAGVLGDVEDGWPARFADYCLQPFMHESRKLLKNPKYLYGHPCLRNKLFYKILLNYIKGLTQTLKHNKLFGFFWEESVSHDILKNPVLMDEGYLDFVTTLEKEKYLNDTVLIMLSDHGMRWGGFAETDQGYLEARLPLLTVLFPTSFRKKYEYAYNNFKINSNRLTTPYDIYWTLVDLVDSWSLDRHHIRERIKARNFDANQMSLFLPVPRNRTCISLGIAEIWCSCIRGTVVPAHAHEASLAAGVLVDYINELLSNYSQCLKLYLKDVVVVTVLKEAKNSGQTYTVTVKTSPGGGVFQGLVRHERAGWAAFGEVTRLNRYGNQSHCVKMATVKLYCFCGTN